MPDAFWLFAAALACLLGMSWLALAMKVHWQQLHNNGTQPNSAVLRVLGALTLALSGVFCLLGDHPSMAVLVWFMLLTSAAFLVAMLLSRRPRWLLLICPGFFAQR